MFWALFAAGCAAIHLGLAGYLLGGLRQACRKSRESAPVADLPPVSIVVCARNEAENLPELLACLQAQNYPDYEILVADDRSDDATPELLQNAAKTDPRVRSIRIEEKPAGWAPKKHALTQAVAAARRDLLLLTDADCRPGPEWAARMAAPLAAGADVALGYSPYATRPGLLNRFIQYETTWTALQYLGAAARGFPYMAVGRSLAYRKQAFYAAGGLESHKAVLSGDDDLLTGALRGRATFAVVCGPEAAVVSRPETSWRAWFRQKTRHVGASAHYRPAALAALGVFHLSQLGVWGAGAFCAFDQNLFAGFFVIFAVYLGWKYALLRNACKYLGAQRISRFFPALEALSALYLLVVAPAGWFGKPKWR